MRFYVPDNSRKTENIHVSVKLDVIKENHLLEVSQDTVIGVSFCDKPQQNGASGANEEEERQDWTPVSMAFPRVIYIAYHCQVVRILEVL